MAKGPEKQDFVDLKQRYEKLGNGQRAEIRRARDFDELVLTPAAWKLGVPVNEYWGRVIFFLPWVEHNSEGNSLGQQLYRGKISELRLFQVLRSAPPNDLEYLRRLVRQIKPKVNWADLGPLLFYWKESHKRRLIEDYYRGSYSKENI